MIEETFAKIISDLSACDRRVFIKYALREAVLDSIYIILHRVKVFIGR